MPSCISFIEMVSVVVGGAPRAVEKVILHAGYRKLPQDIIDAARGGAPTGLPTSVRPLTLQAPRARRPGR